MAQSSCCGPRRRPQATFRAPPSKRSSSGRRASRSTRRTRRSSTCPSTTPPWCTDRGGTRPIPPYYLVPPGYVVGPTVLLRPRRDRGGGARGGFDWGHHSVHINGTNLNAFNRTTITNPTWRHDPDHRRGVPYYDPGVRQQFGQGPRPGVDAREAFRAARKRLRGPWRRLPPRHPPASRSRGAAAPAADPERQRPRAPELAEPGRHRQPAPSRAREPSERRGQSGQPRARRGRRAARARRRRERTAQVNGVAGAPGMSPPTSNPCGASEAWQLWRSSGCLTQSAGAPHPDPVAHHRRHGDAVDRRRRRPGSGRRQPSAEDLRLPRRRRCRPSSRP